MSNYSDEEKAAVLAKARATLEQPMSEREPPPWDEPMPERAPPRVESRNDRWRREHAEREEEHKAEQHRLTDWQAAQVRAELAGIDTKIDAKITEVRAELLDIIGSVSTLAELIGKATDKIDEKVGALRAEMTMHRTIDKSTNVIEMPDVPEFLRRKA